MKGPDMSIDHFFPSCIWIHCVEYKKDFISMELIVVGLVQHYFYYYNNNRNCYKYSLSFCIFLRVWIVPLQASMLATGLSNFVRATGRKEQIMKLWKDRRWYTYTDINVVHL